MALVDVFINWARILEGTVEFILHLFLNGCGADAGVVVF
jgi:hypothetical protein